jgi:hypothetical protein
MRVPGLAAVVAASMLGAASAQPPRPMSPELEKFMSTPEQEAAVKTNARRNWDYLFPSCPKPFFEGARVIVHVPPTFDAAGQPVSGLWQLVSQVRGCGQARLLNAHYIADREQVKRVLTLSGTTIADPYLQMDSLDYAAMAMVKIAPDDCTDYKFTDTAFETFGKAAGARPPWTERWTVQACGVEGVVRMHFAPDATGTQISASPDETVKVP